MSLIFDWMSRLRDADYRKHLYIILDFASKFKDYEDFEAYVSSKLESYRVDEDVK